MKKFITLLFALGAVATSFAQSRDDAKDIINGRKTGTNTDQNKNTTGKDPRDILVIGGRNNDNDRPYPTTYPGTDQQQADQINREYDAKIQSVRNNPLLSETEKERMIAQLNRDRAKKIREISSAKTGKRTKSKKHGEDDDETVKNKGNNGNHYGWEKGKGNPHKNGGKPGKKS